MSATLADRTADAAAETEPVDPLERREASGRAVDEALDETPMSAAVEAVAPAGESPSGWARVPKPVRALVAFAAFAAVPYAHPRLSSLRLLTWGVAPDAPVADGPTGIAPEYGELTLKEAQNEKPPILEDHGEPPQLVAAAGPGASPATSGSSSASSPPVLSEQAKAVGATYRTVEDPSGRAMSGFWAALEKTEKGAPGAITRVAHYGDSLIVSDFMSATLRRRFQQRFGDAGHGFLLMAKPWAWYFHQDVSYWSSDGWRVHRVVNPRIGDELYGYGGATFRALEGGVKSSFGTAKAAPGEPKNDKEAFGRRVSRFDVHYLEQPDGGAFDLVLDGKKAQTVSTRLEAGKPKRLAIAKVTAEDGAHTLEVKPQGGAEARFFGVALERDVPGVVWDALGVNGGRARILDVNDDGHWAESLRARAPALVVLQYGTNESEDTGFPTDQYESTLEAVLRQVKVALPDSACLVVGAMDRAGHGAGGMETRPIIPKLVDSQRKIAFKVGCAFWDAYLAMGGPGAMGRWTRANPRLGGGDLTHPTMAGATLLGDLLYAALMNGYADRAR